MTRRSRTPSDEQKTEIFDPSKLRAQPEPLRMISMKTPAELAAENQAREVNRHQVKLRPLSELGSSLTPPRGNLAPPRDPRVVRARRLRDLVIWGSAVVIVGCVVMLGVWFLAHR